MTIFKVTVPRFMRCFIHLQKSKIPPHIMAVAKIADNTITLNL